MDGFPFPPAPQRFLNKRAAWTSLTVGIIWDLSRVLYFSRGYLCLFPRPCLLSDLCNHCIRPAHCLSLHPLAWGSA